MEIEKKERSWKQVGIGFLIFLIGAAISFSGLQNGNMSTVGGGGLLTLIGLLVMATSGRKRKYKIK